MTLPIELFEVDEDLHQEIKNQRYMQYLKQDLAIKLYNQYHHRFMHKLPYRDKYGRCRSYKRRYRYR